MITVKKSGTYVSSEIKWVNMSPWTSAVKMTEHQIDGADFDLLEHRGRTSPTTTVTGYCSRTGTNIAILEGLKDGSELEVNHSLEGVRTGYCLSLSMQAKGTFITFSMTLKSNRVV